MKKLVFMVLISYFSNGFSQGGWTWMNGDSIAKSQGVFGTQRVLSTNNTPSSVKR